MLSYNEYAYAGNNPVDRVDPTGAGWFSSLINWLNNTNNEINQYVDPVENPFEYVDTGVQAIEDVSIVGRDLVDMAEGTVEASEYGSKFDYLFGKATGSAHNIQRSQAMAKQLSNIGIEDTPEGRQYLQEEFTKAFNNPNSVATVQENGRVVRDFLLAGPKGFLKVESVWEGNRLITAMLYGGK